MLGALYQLIAQVAGIALMLATLALLTRRWGRLARADLIRHGVLTGVVAAALCIAYPEPTPFLALAYFLYLGIGWWRKQASLAAATGVLAYTMLSVVILLRYNVISYVSTPGNTLFLVSFDTTTRAAANVTNLGLNAAEHPYDIATYDSTRVFVGYRAVGGNVYGALVTVSTGAATLMATGEATTADVQVSCASGETLFVAWVNTSARIRVMGFSVSGSTTLAATTVGGTGVTRISACRGESTSTMAIVYQQGTTGGISWLRVTNAGVAVGNEPSSGLWEYTIVSRPWLNLGRLYCALRYGPSGTLQPTYFVMQLDLSPSGASTLPEQAVPVATLAPRIAGAAMSTSEAFAQVTQDGVTSAWYLPLRVLTVVGGATTFGSGARLYTLSFANAADGGGLYHYDEPQGSTTFAGGVQLAYDGGFVCEAGYPHPPEGVTLTSSSTGGSIGAGTYSYAVIYAWTDGLGRVHRSTPSVPVATSALTGSTSSVTLTIPTLSGSWRTRVNGSWRVDGGSGEKDRHGHGRGDG